jgi:hypothetical protein
MREAVVETLVITALDKFYEDPRTVETTLIPLLGTIWLRSRSLCLSICVILFLTITIGVAYVSVLPLEITYPPKAITSQDVIRALPKSLALGLIIPSIIVFLPWCLLRANLRSRQSVMIESLMNVVNAHRPTQAEWAQARATIRRAKPGILDYGIDEQIARFCLH